MLYLAPRAPYAARIALGSEHTGLTGTIRYRLLDNDADQNDPVYGPSTANIIEDPTGSGSYVFHGTAPVTARMYSPVWDTGPGTELLFDEENIFVTSTIAAPGQPSGYDLCTLADVKRYVPSYISNDATDATLQDLITAASELIPEKSGREIVPLSPDTAARTFPVSQQAALSRSIRIGDLAGPPDRVSLLNIDGTLIRDLESTEWYPLYEGERQPTRHWEPVTDIGFQLAPLATLTLLPDFHILEVEGVWGFPTIPAFIREACAARVILRYMTDVDASGTGFASAVRDSGLNLGGLFQSSQDALIVLGGRLAMA
jgi:hypothetical protein